MIILEVSIDIDNLLFCLVFRSMFSVHTFYKVGLSPSRCLNFICFLFYVIPLNIISAVCIDIGPLLELVQSPIF